MNALDRWRTYLGQWAIPDEILRKAPESPWALPPGVFARRADELIGRARSASLRRAAEALAPQGSMLDVGAGAGAASLPLAEMAGDVCAVDSDPAMLAQFEERARRLGLPTRTILGEWPAVAGETPICDVVVCSHVLYNVPELAPFITALDSHARRRVVVEITARHPASTINPLWQRLHGLRRPDRPTWEDAVTVIRETGLQPVIEQETQAAARPQADSFEELVAWTRRRLCLTAERDPEVEAALSEIGVERARPETWAVRSPEVVVLWWDRHR